MSYSQTLMLLRDLDGVIFSCDTYILLANQQRDLLKLSMQVTKCHPG